jgi:hypothetical protein
MKEGGQNAQVRLQTLQQIIQSNPAVSQRYQQDEIFRRMLGRAHAGIPIPAPAVAKRRHRPGRRAASVAADGAGATTRRTASSGLIYGSFPPNVAVRNVAGLNIPQHDYIAFTYHGATNNAATVTYREGGATGTIVATVTFTYTTQPPTVDNTPLATVTRS